jgi:cysteine desulfurase
MGRGGAQERGLRAGTVDAVALAGLETALLRLEESRLGYQRAAQLALTLRQHITAHTRRAVTFHGADVPGLGHVLNLRFDGWKGDELVAALDLEGICISSGSACSAGTAEPSAVITAMLGLEAAVGAVRISLGEESRGEDMVALVDALVRLGILNKVEDLASRFSA